MGKLAGFVLFSVFLISFTGKRYSEGVRYRIEQNALQDLITKFPERRNELERMKKDELPSYMDFYILDDCLVEIYWKCDSTLQGIVVNPQEDNGTINISNTGELKIEKYETLGEFKYSESRDTVIDNISLQAVDLKIGELSRRYIFEKDSLRISQNVSLSQRYPEESFINTFRVIPIKILMGAPKQLVTFHVEKKLELENENMYQALIENSKSIRKRRAILRRLEMN